MKIYMYGSLAESFDSMSVPWKGMVEFTDCGDLRGNSGWTDRSFHCFTLYINGHVIFTSGEFWRCYMEIKNR